MSIVIHDAGLFSTIQDLGRQTYRQYGIPLSGVMDRWSAIALNILVGNSWHSPVIEMFQKGLTVTFNVSTVIALGGADMEAQLDGKVVRNGQPIRVDQGSVLRCGHWTHGAWGYLAVAGGFDACQWLASYSTDLQAQRGGWNGRKLQVNDEIPIRFEGLHSRSNKHGRFFVASETVNRQNMTTIRVLHGEHFNLLSEKSQTYFPFQKYTVHPSMNRMGYRLSTEALEMANADMLTSQPVLPGTVQLPPNGMPIVLMADAQTIGGYPVVAHVISADLPLMSQVRAGHSLQFQFVTEEQAVEAYRQKIRDLKILEAAVKCWRST